MNCFFCQGKSGSGLTREHLLSKPICEFFEIDRATTTLGRVDASGEEPSITSVASLDSTAVRLPCDKCNNGRMNDLETQMVSLLENWVRGHAPLDQAAVGVMGRWLAKTHLMLTGMEGGIRWATARPLPRIGISADSSFGLSQQRFDHKEFSCLGD